MLPFTDLEALVRHLAGREPGNPLDGQHNDPTSDAAQILDEIRRRTRSLLEPPEDAASEGPPVGWPGATAGVVPVGSARRRAMLSQGLPLLLGLALAVGGAWVGWSWSRLTANRESRALRLVLDEVRARLAAPLPVAPAPVDPGLTGPVAADLVRQWTGQLAAIDARLARLGPPTATAVDPLGASAPAPPSNRAAAPDPVIVAFSADVAAVRRELTGSEAAITRQIQEMKSILQEVNTVVRRVLSRPEPTNNAALGPLLALAVQALTHNLAHPSAQVRGEAVEQLARIGLPARTAIPALQSLHDRESDRNVRSAIEAALSILTSN